MMLGFWVFWAIDEETTFFHLGQHMVGGSVQHETSVSNTNISLTFTYNIWNELLGHSVLEVQSMAI